MPPPTPGGEVSLASCKEERTRAIRSGTPVPGGMQHPHGGPRGSPGVSCVPPPRPCGPPAGDRGRPVTAFSRRDGGGAPPGVGGQGRSPRFWGYPLPKARTAPLGSYPSQPTSPIP